MGGRRAHDQLRGQYPLAGGYVDAVHDFDEHSHRLATDVTHRLCERRERGIGIPGKPDVVEADDGDIFGNFQTARPDTPHRAQSHLVVRAEYGGKALTAGEYRFNGTNPRFQGEITFRCKLGIALYAGAGQRRLVALMTIDADRTLHRSRDEGDCAMEIGR